MQIKYLLNNRRLQYTLYALGLLLLLTAGVALWVSRHFSNEAVFWRMIDSSLKTASVTRTVSQSANGQKIEQLQQIQFAGVNQQHSVTTLTQSNSIVQTESLATPDKDYVRYTKFEAGSRIGTAQRKELRNVIGVWATDAGQNEFESNAFSLLPMAYLNEQDRKELIAYLKTSKALTPDFYKVTSSKINGKEVRTFSVNLRVMPYIRYVKQVAAKTGITAYDAIDPTQYADAPAETLRLSIAPASGQLVRAEYASSGQIETYSGYGISSKIEPPKKAISAQELQSRVAKALQQ